MRDAHITHLVFYPICKHPVIQPPKNAPKLKPTLKGKLDSCITQHDSCPTTTTTTMILLALDFFFLSLSILAC